VNTHLAGRPEPTASRALSAKVLDGLSGYALLGWAYIAANSITHPATLHLGLTHFASWPHERTFGIACFVLSGVLYLAARVAQGGSRS
jgi:hypothetical protein